MCPSTDAPPEWRRLLMTFLHFRAVARMQAVWASDRYADTFCEEALLTQCPILEALGFDLAATNHHYHEYYFCEKN